MWVFKKNSHTSGHGLAAWSRSGRGTITIQSSAELLEWERDVDTLEFEVSQSQVYSKGTFDPGRPCGVCEESLRQIKLPLCACEDLNSILLEHGPYSPPPAMLQGGLVPGDGGAEPRRAERQTRPPIPGLSVPPAQDRPHPRLAREGACIWGWLLGKPKVQLAGRTSDTFGSSQPESKARTLSAVVPRGVGNFATLCAAVRGEKRKPPFSPPTPEPGLSQAKPTSQVANTPCQLAASCSRGDRRAGCDAPRPLVDDRRALTESGAAGEPQPQNSARPLPRGAGETRFRPGPPPGPSSAQGGWLRGLSPAPSARAPAPASAGRQLAAPPAGQRREEPARRSPGLPGRVGFPRYPRPRPAPSPGARGATASFERQLPAAGREEGARACREARGRRRQRHPLHGLLPPPLRSAPRSPRSCGPSRALSQARGLRSPESRAVRSRGAVPDRAASPPASAPQRGCLLSSPASGAACSGVRGCACARACVWVRCARRAGQEAVRDAPGQA